MTVDINSQTYSERFRDFGDMIDKDIAARVAAFVAIETEKLQSGFAAVANKCSDPFFRKASAEEINFCLSVYSADPDKTAFIEYVLAHPSLLGEYKVLSFVDPDICGYLLSKCSESDLKSVFEFCCVNGDLILGEQVSRSWSLMLHSSSSLDSAVRSGNSSMVEFLLSQGISNPGKSLPLAISLNNFRIVELILSRMTPFQFHEIDPQSIISDDPTVSALLATHRVLLLSTEGNAKFKDGDYAGAINKYTEAILISPIDDLSNLSKLEYNISKSYFRIEKYLHAIFHATNCLKFDSQYSNGYFLRCNAYLELYDMERAKIDYDLLLKLNHPSETLSNRFNDTFYDILNLPIFASETEVKTNYRNLARKFHPDKVSSDSSDDVKIKSRNIFNRIQKAYETLSSMELKPDYDMNLRIRISTENLKQNLHRTSQK